MSGYAAFRTPAGEAAFLAAYDAAMAPWPVPYDSIDVRSRFGTTHVVICGPADAPPLVLLHGYMATSTMWWPNVGEWSREHRVYAIDVMGQAGRSRPDTPICSTADYVSWLTATLDALHLTRTSLVGMSFGGWLALNYAVAAPERIEKLILLSPGGLLPMVRQFMWRALLMVFVPSRLTVNSFFHWLGFTGVTNRRMLDLMLMGLKHFRMPPETMRVEASVVSDQALRSLPVPTLLLFGEGEVICDPVRALARARRLIPDFRGELIPACRHEMCTRQHEIVDARVLDFLKVPTNITQSAPTARSVA